MKATTLRWYMLAIMGTSIFLLLATSVLEILPITNGNNDLVISQQANFQLARLEFLVKDVYALTYRSDTVRAQAIGEMQVLVPDFEQAQKGLMAGDATLGLPGNPSPGVSQALTAASPDYEALIAAMHVLLTDTDKSPDLVQATIVFQHDRPYETAMYPVTTLLMQEAQARRTLMVIVENGLIGVTILLIILKYLVFTMPVLKRQIKEEQAANEGEEESTQKEHPP